MELRPGDTVTDTLRLVRKLGQGGMGSVWIARHSGLEIEVAVKFIAPELVSKVGEELSLARFHREAKLAAKIDSPHVVRIFDHGIAEDGTPYITMELLKGESLYDRLRRLSRIDPKAVSEIVRDVAEGLERAHALGIIHRDIKPPNILLTNDAKGRELAKILDFGIAKSQGGDAQSVATSSGALIGTPQYMSPEQLMKAKEPDRSADVWALSVVAYEMLTGRLPFVGETLAATLVAITRGEVAPPTSEIPSLPRGLDAFFRKALASEPENRFATASSLSIALAATLDGDPTWIASEPSRRTVLAGDTALSTSEFLEKVAPSSNERAPRTPQDAKLELAATEPSIPPARPVPTPMTSTPVEDATPAGDALALPPPRRYRWLLALAAAAIVPTYLLATRSSGSIAGSETSAAVSVEPIPTVPISATSVDSAGATASGSAATAPSAATSKIGIERTEVGAGLAPHSDLWVSEYAIVREEGDEDAAFAEARAACVRRGMMLCNEAQWARACETIPAVAKLSSWTRTPGDGARGEKGIVVRGGGDEGGACKTRAVVESTSHAPSRVGFCCSQGIAVRSETPNIAFLRTTSRKLLEYETALNQGNASAMRRMVFDPVEFHGRKVTPDELGPLIAWSAMSRTLAMDQCAVGTQIENSDRRWIAECTGLETTLKTGELKAVSRRYRWSGDGLLIEAREPKVPVVVTPAR